MRCLVLLTTILAFGAAPALANPCGFDEAGKLVVVGYDTGATAVPADQKEKLAEFADVAKHRFEICIFAQVDKQGTEAANKRVADARANAVRDFLMARGVKSDTVKIAKQDKGFTLFGLLKDNQDDDRRVTVTHN